MTQPPRRRLPPREWRLVAGVLAAQVLLRAGIRLVPVRSLSRRIPACRAAARRLVAADDDRVAWAIEAAGRHVPWISTCLVRALAADLFLSAPEASGHVRIGIRRSETGALQSHAWFERDGRIVVGGAGAAEYVELVTLETTAAEHA